MHSCLSYDNMGQGFNHGSSAQLPWLMTICGRDLTMAALFQQVFYHKSCSLSFPYLFLIEQKEQKMNDRCKIAPPCIVLLRATNFYLDLVVSGDF